MKFFETELGSWHLGNSLELIKEVPDRSIDVIFTDPPFGASHKDEGPYNDPDNFYRLIPELYRVLKPNSYMIIWWSVRALDELLENAKPFN